MINETGTFYLEGEYQQGDTILSSGDWQLRADGSKNVFAYTPDTFVRRNLLNWSEDFSRSSWVKQEEVTATKDAINFLATTTAPSSVSPRIYQTYTVPNRDGMTFTATITIPPASNWSDPSAVLRLGLIGASIQNITAKATSQVVTVTNTYSGVGTLILFTMNADKDVTITGISEPQLELGSTPTPYQRTTTHVPRPYAIKDELVTNGTFDTDTDGWSLQGSATLEWNPIGALSITSSNIGGTGAFQVITTKAGLTYKVSAEVLSIAANMEFQLWVNNGTTVATSFATSALNNDTGVRELEFTAQSANTVIYLRRISTNSNSGTVTIDNISVKEIQQPITLGNASHKDFRYYPRALSTNEQEALKA